MRQKWSLNTFIKCVKLNAQSSENLKTIQADLISDELKEWSRV